MANIKPIETCYNGYRFRSRLEARWAVFFNAINADWEYEPEGFVLKDGTYYLPDFRLRNVRGRGINHTMLEKTVNDGEIYVEIKGILTDEDLHKIELFPFPIIIFGQIPDEKLVTSYYDGKYCSWWEFDFSKDNNEHFYNLEFSEGDYYWTEPVAAKDGGLVLDYPDDCYDFTDNELTKKAYRKARQARFEHGECG